MSDKDDEDDRWEKIKELMEKLLTTVEAFSKNVKAHDDTLSEVIDRINAVENWIVFKEKR